MKLRVFFIGVVLILAMAVTAVGAEIAGKWIAEQEGPQGTQQTTFDFKVSGTTLTGTMTGGRGGDAEISEGNIEGDNISFAVVRTIGENEMKTLYKGAVSGDEIKFTIERQGGGAGRGAAGGPGGGMGGPGGGMGGPSAGGMGGPGGGMGAKPGGGQRGGAQELVAKRAK